MGRGKGSSRKGDKSRDRKTFYIDNLFEEEFLEMLDELEELAIDFGRLQGLIKLLLLGLKDEVSRISEDFPDAESWKVRVISNTLLNAILETAKEFGELGTLSATEVICFLTGEDVESVGKFFEKFCWFVQNS